MDLFKRLFSRTKEDRSLTSSSLNIGASSSSIFNIGSGKTVTKDNILTVPAFFAAVNLLANTISTLPLHVMRNQGSRTAKVPSHPVSKLLRKRPNPFMSPCDLKHPLQVDLCIHGNAFAQIVRSPNGNVKEIWPLDASKMIVEFNNSVMRYKYTSSNGVTVFEAKDILHLKFAPELGLVGRSPLQLFRESVGISLAGQSTASVYMSQGATLSGVLETDMPIGDEARGALKEGWKRMFTGPQSAGEVAILRQGMHYKPLNINVKDLQFLESRQFQIAEIARMFSIQPHLLGDLSRSTNNNIEQQGMEFIKYTLLPWICRWEEEINLKLFQDENTFVKFNLNGLERADIQSRTESYRRLFEIGVMTRNEIRALEDLNPLEDVDSNTAHTPVNIMPSDLLRTPTEAAEEVIQDRSIDYEDKARLDALEAVKRACTETIHGKVKTAFANILQRHSDDLEACKKAVMKFFDTNLVYCERTFTPYYKLDKRSDCDIAKKVHQSLFDTITSFNDEDLIEKLTQLING